LCNAAFRNRSMMEEPFFMEYQTSGFQKVQLLTLVQRMGDSQPHLQFYVESLLQRSKARQKAIELVASSNVIERDPA
jgi:hypothetical protein